MADYGPTNGVPLIADPPAPEYRSFNRHCDYYECQKCSTLIADRDTHTAWHRRNRA